MLVCIEAYKENFRELVRRIRKELKNSDGKYMYQIIDDAIRNRRQDVYFNKESWELMNVYKFSDGFEIEITEKEFDALYVILFYEIDLMQTNKIVQI